MSAGQAVPATTLSPPPGADGAADSLAEVAAGLLWLADGSRATGYACPAATTRFTQGVGYQPTFCFLAPAWSDAGGREATEMKSRPDNGEEQDRPPRPRRTRKGGGRPAAPARAIGPRQTPEEVAAQVRRLSPPALVACGLGLVDVEVVPQNRRVMVRVVVDKPGGSVGVDDCARFSRQLGDILDVHDAITAAYVLEVSSPGVFRPLKKPEDFAWAVGRRIKLVLRRPVGGRAELVGGLEAFDGRTIFLALPEGGVAVALEDVARARLEADLFE